MKVLHYNSYLVRNLPEQEIKKYEQYLDPNYKEILDNWAKTPRMNTCLLRSFQTSIDRTGTKKHFCNIKNLYPTPKWNLNFKKTFSEVSDERAISLLNENKVVNVYWSGGLDSTNVLFSFLNNVKHKDQVIVRMNYNSILESGFVFETFIKNNLNYKIETVRLNGVFLDPDQLHVTGHLGENVMGDNGRHIGKKMNDKKLSLTDSIFDFLDETTYEFFKPVMDKFCPMEIETIKDFEWFMIMNYRWQNSALAHMFLIGNKTLGNNFQSVVKPFYDSYDFQQWSLQNNLYEKYNFDPSIDKPDIKANLLRIAGEKIKDYNTNKNRNASCYTNYNRNYLLTTENFENIFVSDDVVRQVYNIKFDFDRTKNG